jgi:TNF receptor-associated factor 3
LSEAVAQQKVMQQKTLEACYQSVDNLQKEIQAVVSRMEQYMKMSTDKAIKMEEMVSLQAVQIQRLEERQAKNQGSISSSESVREMFTAQDRVLATHDIKLAEHSLRLDMMDCKNTDGVLLWKITEVRRRRREAVSGKTPSIYSQPFYTSQCGYKMCARMYLNGDGMGRGTHLSLFFVVMRGEYDSLLPWPFSHKVTLILIDQVGQRHISDTFRPDPQSSSFVRPKNEMNVASGCPLFVSLMTLDSGGYVKDDAMFIKMVIDTTNVHKPDMR